MKEIMVMVKYKVQISLTNTEYIYYSVNSISFFVCRINGSQTLILTSIIQLLSIALLICYKSWNFNSIERKGTIMILDTLHVVESLIMTTSKNSEMTFVSRLMLDIALGL